jgi:hypothetical protein
MLICLLRYNGEAGIPQTGSEGLTPLNSPMKQLYYYGRTGYPKTVAKDWE